MKSATILFLLGLAECRSLDKHLRVEGIFDGISNNYSCSASVDRLKKAPQDHEAIIQKGEEFTDEDFKRTK